MKLGDEVVVGPPCRHGQQTVISRDDDGKIRTGSLAKPGQGNDDGDELVELTQVRGNRYKVTEVIRFTARSRPSTAAYRSGWERTFGKSASN